MFRKPACKVVVAGQDVTSRFWPVLKEVNVEDRDGLSTDSCRMSLADVDGSIKLPEESATVEVYLGDSEAGVGLVFTGFIDEVRSRGAKRGGRELVLSAKGMDTNSKLKEPVLRHEDDKTFGDVAQQWFQKAGVSVVVDPELAQISRPYWSMQGESPIAWGQRVAREIGATFKVQGGQAVFVKTGAGTTASGAPLPMIRAAWGDNLIDWDIAPIVSRPRFRETTARHYDPKSGKWKTVGIELTNEKRSRATSVNRFSRANEDTAKQQAEADRGRSERNGGEGSVQIIGTPDAKPEGTCIVSGARPGIDGSYRIDGVTHRLNKRGYTVNLSLKQPQGDAGTDSRTPSSSGAGTPNGRFPGPV